MVPALVLLGLLLSLGFAAFFFRRQATKRTTERNTVQQQLDAAQQRLATMTARFQPILDVEAEQARIKNEGAALLEQQQRQKLEAAQLQTNIEVLQKEFAALDEESNLQSFGYYKPRYDFATSSAYAAKLDEVRQAQKRLITQGSAATCSTTWTVNGSEAAGRKQIAHVLKLILRGFNGECDAAIAKVKYNNVLVMETRIRKSFEAINKLVDTQHCSIETAYLKLRLQELSLVHEHQEKVQAEKELQRQVREQMREEELAQRELEKAKADAEKEEKRYADALQKAQREVEQATGEKQQKLLAQITMLQEQLSQAQQQKQRAISQAQLTRSGHVYVISNIGSFGEDVYKIGMTRRLEPLDRVRELGDASVPFQFDVHAIIYCEDAPKLENTLHRVFHHRRMNRINERKEFFRVSLAEIAQAVHANHGEIEFLHEAEAQEYRQTLALAIEKAA